MAEPQAFIGVAQIVVATGAAAVLSVIMGQKMLPVFGIRMVGKIGIHIQPVVHGACPDNPIQFIVRNIEFPLWVKVLCCGEYDGFPLQVG